MAKWLDGLESAVGGGPGGPKRVRSLRWLLLIGCLGIGLIIVNSFLTMQEVEPAADTENQPPADQEAFAGRQSGEGSAFEGIEGPLETRLKDILEKIVGVGTVDVLVTVDATEEVVYEKNGKTAEQVTEETDVKGGRRHITSETKEGQVVIYEVSGDGVPVVIKKIQPRVRGILVVAKGAENATVRKLIEDAVQRGVNIASHRISVVPRKQG
ncbi:stage III sporulation protein AG [Paenibacillus sambharensis]|uniref:Stage III sporulation protein AG n=1 Tax=Paenibacillus sambharensis TaxID=1803190 RepID=A0A2W1L2Z5_9BACL|nr:stage III sporulation protein AG [Paenibacillus sambharensis]PZD93433.1 stage III sporulation protein AG [Paenibacillus sambharensis]